MNELLKDGVDVIVSEEIISNAPLCIHGPTLLFERLTKSGRRKFYACSACRNRKDCSFFQWADEPQKDSKRLNPKPTKNDVDQTTRNHRWNLLTNAINDNKKLNYCKTCSKILLNPSEESHHVQHNVCQSLTKQQLQRPTLLIQPVENNKKEAQFYFTHKTTEFFISTLKSLKLSSVMCIGCPRIYERLREEVNMNTILLDIDERLRQFYSPDQFVLYNMFNHHFFDDSSCKKIYEDFLRSASAEKLAILMDPPFGGMVEPLAFTLTKITKDWHRLTDIKNSKVPAIFWVFPYFMETKIVESFPTLKMLEYQVNYDNHQSFKSKDADSGRVSPIRIFTNLSEDVIILPEYEGYRFCEICRRYVSKLNRHCTKCNSCTSKNGRPYVHCDICQKCSKETSKHCDTCGRCCPQQHRCDDEEAKFEVGCHKCGSLKHKKNHCNLGKKKRFKK